MPFACIFVPDFPVEALLRAEPELRSQAVAVLEGNSPLQKVFAVNEKARRAGVEPGMTKLQVETCADLVLRTRSPLQENATHTALLDCAQSFSPRVEDAGCDIIVLDLAVLPISASKLTLPWRPIPTRPYSRPAAFPASPAFLRGTKLRSWAVCQWKCCWGDPLVSIANRKLSS